MGCEHVGTKIITQLCIELLQEMLV